MIIIIVLVLSLFYYELERFECDLYFAEQFSHFLRGGAARMFHGGRVLCRAGRPTLVATQSQEIRKIRFWRTTAPLPHHKKHSHRLTAHIYKL